MKHQPKASRPTEAAARGPDLSRTHLRAFLQKSGEPLAKNVRLRGFTLIEVMVVVVIISILAALAIPSISQRLRDRRVRQAAQEAADMYRTARMRAMGRGAAMLFSYSAAGGKGRFELREAVVGGSATNPACRSIPDTGCQRDWTTSDPATDVNQLLTTFDFDTAGHFEETFIEAEDGSGAPVDTMEVCFTPLGRTFVRYAAAQPFVPLVGVPSLRVFRSDGQGPVGRQRHVALLPNGTARMTSE